MTKLGRLTAEQKMIEACIFLPISAKKTLKSYYAKEISDIVNYGAENPEVEELIFNLIVGA